VALRLRADRPRFASDDKYNGTPAETRAAFEGSLAYFGRYDVDEDAGIVRHHILGCTFPNWMGTSQTRHFVFSGNRLTLRTTPMPMEGAMITGELVWERIA
jgi:hypothetical protein